MKTINRSAIAVIPAQPFLDWLHQADPTSAHLSLNDLKLEPRIYLLPESIAKNRRASICKGGARRCLNNNWMAGIAFQPHGLLIEASEISSTGLTTRGLFVDKTS